MKNLNMICPVGFTGYGIASLNILKHLSNKYNISLFPVGNPKIENQEEYNVIQNSVNNQEFFDYNANCFKIWHQFDLALRVGKGEFTAFPFFELDTLTKREIHHLSYTDKIIVASEWAKNVIKNNGIDIPTYVAPLGVDRKIFDDTKVNTDASQNMPYVFITIGKWEIRKGHDVIIESFNKAFDTNDNVELWMVTENPFLNEEQTKAWTDMAQNSKLASKIRLFSRLQTHENLAEVMSYSNCGLFISRGEGWNLELLEMMSMGKPVIATNYSSHTEFCTKNNSYLIDTNETEPAIDNKWFNGEGNWAKITESHKEQVVEQMRYVYTNNIKTNPGGIETANKYSWENTANIISEILEK
jgi:glycosyltransferase involved in cell wall biosynthesis